MRRDTRSEDPAGRQWHTASEIEEVLEVYRESGLTPREFAREAGVSVSTLQLWLRKARLGPGVKRASAEGGGPVPEISLLEVELAGAGPKSTGGTPIYEIELATGSRLRLGGGFADGEVRRLLLLLEEVG